MLSHEERRVLAVCAFVSACLCFGPKENVAGGMLVGLSAGLYLWDLWTRRREGRAPD